MDEADLTPDDIAHATKALVRRQEIAMKEKQALMASGAAPLLALARDRRTAKTQEFERYEHEKQDLTSARAAEAIKWAHNHPNDPRAKAILYQEKALERRTSGTQEFERYEHEKQDLASARAAEAIKWAQKHPNDPRAQAILDRERARSNPKTLGRAKAALLRAGRTATHTALALIASTLGAAVKFLSALPGVASDVNKMAAAGNSLGLSDDRLRGYRHVEDMLKLDEGTFAQGFGALLHKLPPIETGMGDLGKAISPVAAYAQKDPLGRDIIGMIVDASKDSEDVFPLWRESLNMAMRIGYAGKGRLGSEEVDPALAIRDALNVFDQLAPKVAVVGAKMQTWLENSSAANRAAVRAVVSGEAREINGVAVEAGDFYGAMAALLGEDVSWVKPRDVSTPVEVAVSKEVAQSWTDLGAAFGAIKRGVLEQILGATENISVWLEDIMHKILGLDIFGHRFDPTLRGFDEKYYAQHISAAAELDNLIVFLEGAAKHVGGKQFGHATEESRAAAIASWERGEGVPADVRRAGLADEYEKYIGLLYELDEARMKRADSQFYVDMFERKNQPATHAITGESKLYENGAISRPYGITPEQIAVVAANRVAADAYLYVDSVDEITERVLTGNPASSYEGLTQDVAAAKDRLFALNDARSVALNTMLYAQGLADSAAEKLADEEADFALHSSAMLAETREARRLLADSYAHDLSVAKRDLERATATLEKADADVASAERGLAEKEAALRGASPLDVGAGRFLVDAVADREEARRLYEEQAELERRPALNASAMSSPGYVPSEIRRQQLVEAESRVARTMNALAEIEESYAWSEEPAPPFSRPSPAETAPGASLMPGAPLIGRYLGQAGLEGDLLRRSLQEQLAFTNSFIAELGAQAGASAVSAFANRRLEISGRIKAEERTWTVELVHKDTGETFRVVGKSASPLADVEDLSLLFDSYVPTPNPASR
jgi:hypothetical protein